MWHTPDFVERMAAGFTGGFVVAFHGIAPQKFSALVEGLGPFRPVPLGELVERSKRGSPTKGLFAITVDDGEGENVRALAAVMLQRQWPGTFYLPTNYVDNRTAMAFQLWRSIEPLLAGRVIRLESAVLDFSIPGALERFRDSMQRLRHTQKPDACSQTLTALAEALTRDHAVTWEALASPLPVGWDEVASLSRSDLIRFESHGVSHTAVSALSEEEIIFEMCHSRDVVSQRTGRPCRHLAYPYGSPRSIGPLAPRVAARFYDSAATMVMGSVDGADPFLLPRIPLYESTSRRKARLKLLLNCRALPGASGAARRVGSGARAAAASAD